MAHLEKEMRNLRLCGLRLGAIILCCFASVKFAVAAVDLNAMEAIDPALVEVDYVSTQYDRRTGHLVYKIAVTNLSGVPINGQTFFALSDITPEANLENADDSAISGEPVVIVGDGIWEPDTAINLTLIWSLTDRVRLDFQINAYVQNDVELPVISTFSASTQNLVSGQSAELSWTVTGADTVMLEPGVGSVSLTGQQSVTPATTTTFILTATNSGGSISESLTITVQPRLNLQIRATPATSDAPVSIRFTPLPDTFTAINLYRWDFDGNGTYDRVDTVGRDQTYYYSLPGHYVVKLEATASDNTVQIATYDLHITNKIPDVTASVSTSNGQVPLTVSFFASATDSDGIQAYSWDFDGDGTEDYTSGSTGNTTHIYSIPGQYQASLTVTDSLGASRTVSLPDIEIRAVPEGNPTISLSPSPASGTAPLQVNFSAIPTVADDVQIESWAWDFDGDGNIDSTADGNASYEYEIAGVYFPSVTITTSDNLTATDVKKITAISNAPILHRVNQHTINPDIGQSSTIQSTLYSTTNVQLQIEDSEKNVVRVLVPWQFRANGAYSDSWDGRNESGSIMPEGPYYAVLLYDAEGETKQIDLRDSTGGGQYNPPRSYIVNNFSPYDNDPLDITFTLSRPSEVTSFMGLFNTNTRLVTFHQREPLGGGNYTIFWNGDAPNGQLIEPIQGNPFLFGIWGWYLADNVVYIRNAPSITGLTAYPSVFNPSSRNAEATSDGKGHIRFTLSKASDIELVVSDVDAGTEVYHLIFPNQQEGELDLSWDGRNDSGQLLAPGTYRVGVRATDRNGSRSMFMFALQRIYY